MRKIPGLYHLNRQVGMLLALLLGLQVEVFAPTTHGAPGRLPADPVEQLDVSPDRPAFLPDRATLEAFRSAGISRATQPAGHFLPAFCDDCRHVAISLRLQENNFLKNKVRQLRTFIYSIQHNIDPPDAGKNVS